MIAMLELEKFTVASGSQYRGQLTGNAPWVAEVKGLSRDGRFVRDFLKADVDYSRANSVGSRGVYHYYHLQSGRIYEVAARLSWKRTVQYFCYVNGNSGEIVHTTRQDVLAALQGTQNAPIQAIARGIAHD